MPEYYDVSSSDRTDDEAGALRQVAVDVPRTAPGVPFFHQQRVQKVLERVLFIWGLRYVGEDDVPLVCGILYVPLVCGILYVAWNGLMWTCRRLIACRVAVVGGAIFCV